MLFYLCVTELGTLSFCSYVKRGEEQNFWRLTMRREKGAEGGKKEGVQPQEFFIPAKCMLWGDVVFTECSRGGLVLGLALDTHWIRLQVAVGGGLSQNE